MFAIETELVEKRREIDAREAKWLELVAEYDASEVWRASGHLSAAAALRRLCRMDAGQAASEVKLARKVGKLEAVRAALAAGDVSRRHVEAIAVAYTPERESALAALEDEFVDAARRFEPREVRNLVRYVSDALDGDGGAASDEEQFARRRWHMSRTIDGLLKIDALVSGVDAEYWETAIRAEMERERVAGDVRTPAQWRADAATNIARRALDTGSLGSSRDVRPHVTVVIDVNELPGSTRDLVEMLQHERRYRGGLSQASIDRLLCDCDVSRVLMAGKSEVLDVGRAERTVSRAQWKALVARDGHCIAPHCNAPPERCEAHHRWRWDRGGPTDLDNLELLCWAHHRERHRHRGESETVVGQAA